MDPNCLRCGHPYSAHFKNSEMRCKRRTLTGWDEAAKTFSHQQQCACDGYQGRIPNPNITKTGCPHECLEGSRVCVVCKRPVPAKAKR